MKNVCEEPQRKDILKRYVKNKKLSVSVTEAAIEDKFILRYRGDFINHYSSTVFEK